MVALRWAIALAAYISISRAAPPPAINHVDPEYIRTYGPFASWKTEPQLESSIVEVVKGNNASKRIYDGHIMFTTTTFKLGGHSWGPQIFDSSFNLVYMSSPEHKIASQDPHVCDFQGQTGGHLCMGAVGGLTRGRGKSIKLIYNSSYVDSGKSYGPTGGLQHPDGHEYNMLEGGRSFLQLIYEPRQMDLRAFSGDEDGYALDACLQEVLVATGDAVFQWCYLDHYPVWETYIFPAGNTVNLTSPIAGKGTKDSRWDLIHSNAADKNFEGDYIVSGRHLDQIIKIAGNNNPHGVAPGTVLWRLGGKSSDFSMNDAIFSRQHHARFVETTANYTIISLFDNSWEGKNPPSHDASAGRIIQINNVTMEAKLLREYVHPEGALSLAQGSMQILPNKNAFVGWGWNPQISEFQEDGSLLYHARLTRSKEIFAYRVFKNRWVGKPLWPPKILAYTQSCTRGPNSPLIAYVSWNGATEVHSYRFYVSLHGEQGPWVPAGEYPKKGFETEVQLMETALTKHLPFVRHVFVEALDLEGDVLGSASTKTFVPMDWAAKQCNEKECFRPHRFGYDAQFNSSDKCTSSSQPAFVVLVFALVALECLYYIYHRMIKLCVEANDFTSPQRAHLHTKFAGRRKKVEGIPMI